MTITVAALTGCYLEFDSNMPAADTFDPEVTVSGSAPYWRLPDDIVRQGDIYIGCWWEQQDLMGIARL